MTKAIDNVRLPFFPVPGLGEIVFSVVGRCIERLGIANAQLLALITGQRLSTTLFSALPGYLGNISRAMPYGHPWTDIRSLIRNNTALPYYTYFHTENQRALSIELLSTAGNPQPIYLSLGLSRYKIPSPPPTARFCLNCLKEQYQQSGYSYFQVAHQLPGISHCWKHGELLCDGCMNCGPYPLKGKKLTMPGQCLCESFTASPIQTLTVSAEPAYWLAQQSQYLLMGSSDTSCERRKRLREGVLRSGLCRGSRIDYDLLAKAIEWRFGIEFLQSINYPARTQDGRASAWLRRSLPRELDEKRLPTIVGLLILGATFDSVEAFENNRISGTPSDFNVQPSHNYDYSPPPWALGLRESLAEHAYNISVCARKLRISSWTLAVEAKNQGITIPLSRSATERIGIDRLDKIRDLLRLGVEKNEIVRCQKISHWTLLLIELDDLNLSLLHRTATESKRRELHRKRIQDFLLEHPNATRLTINKELAGAYDFMLRKDREWFFQNVHQASRKCSRIHPRRNDWAIIDKSLAEAIKNTAIDMKSSAERPVRITKTMLLKHHRALQKYHAEPSRFPITTEVLEEVEEMPGQFLERKVRWGVRRLIASGVEISLDVLRRETAISDIRLKRHSSVVRQVIAELGARISEKSILHALV